MASLFSVEQTLARRQKVIAQMQPNSACIVPAAQLVTRSNDTEYVFRQDSDFHYLCGFPEPDAVLLLSNSERFDGSDMTLICLPKDQLAEIWHGRRIGADAAIDQFDLDHAFSTDEIEDILLDYLDGHAHLYFAMGQHPAIEELLMTLLQSLRNAPKQSRVAPASILDIRPMLHEMRLFKDQAELAIMRQAAKISCVAHTRAMQFCAPGRHEYQLEAEIHHSFAMQGARSPAYGTIVGSGDNACILHYTQNSCELKSGDLVLIDAGAELHGYAADITRTFPVSGRFSEPQKQIYQLVLDAQLASFAFFKPGCTFKQATDKAVAVLTQGLLDLGILKGDLAENIEKLHYRQFFMHGLGHWLGLDVHDVGTYKIAGQDRSFEPGMVLTVEPGIYISPDAEVAEKWRGVGVRIEDNLVITETGHEILTQAAPKTIAEIEALMTTQVKAVEMAE